MTTSGSLGLLFPPSLPIILYSIVAGVSIDKLFVAGLVPGCAAGGDPFGVQRPDGNRGKSPADALRHAGGVAGPEGGGVGSSPCR